MSATSPASSLRPSCKWARAAYSAHTMGQRTPPRWAGRFPRSRMQTSSLSQVSQDPMKCTKRYCCGAARHKARPGQGSASSCSEVCWCPTAGLLFAPTTEASEQYNGMAQCAGSLCSCGDAAKSGSRIALILHFPIATHRNSQLLQGCGLCRQSRGCFLGRINPAPDHLPLALKLSHSVIMSTWQSVIGHAYMQGLWSAGLRLDPARHPHMSEPKPMRRLLPIQAVAI